MKELKKIVLTGGPCAGKTTAMSMLSRRLENLGWNVIVVSEAATELISNGVSPREFKSVLDFQDFILKYQLAREKLYEQASKKFVNNNKVIILLDRGAIDNKAYLKDGEFAKILKKNELNETEVRDSYDAVFHMVTAAKGAAKFYTLENNQARSETPEQACAVDDRILKAWTGHPHLRIIDNSTDFEHKLSRLIEEVLKFLGEPISTEIERKFLIKKPDLNSLLKNYICKKIKIVQTYLKSNGKNEVRVRQRGNDGSYTFTKTIKKYVDDITRVEIESKISHEEYLQCLMSADTERKPIIKDRYTFIYKNQYFELDCYPNWKKEAILEIEMASENQPVELPPDVEVIKEVTNDANYKNFNLSKIKMK